MISRLEHLRLSAAGMIGWHLGGLLLLLSAMMYLFPTTVTGLYLLSASQETFYIPHTFNSIPAVYEIEGVLSIDLRPSTRHLTMRADDCVESVAVDGTPIFEQSCGVCRNCDVFQLALPDTVSTGTHELSLRIRNLQGVSTFDLRQAHGFGLIESGVALAIALAWLWVVRRRQLAMWAWWVVVIALLLAFGYYLNTDLWTRQMDVEGHRDYVQFILTQHAFPRVNAGWETFQPPLYYALSAKWIAIGTWLSSAESWRWLQALAMVAYLTTVMIGVSIWNKFGLAKSGWPGLALFVFLPANLYLSARINNDVLLPLWGTLIAFFLWDYAQYDRLPSLWAVSFCAVAAMLTKTSGLPLFAGAVLFIGWHERTKGRTIPQTIDRLSWFVLPGLIWILVWGLINYSQTRDFFYSNAALNASGLRMVNNAYRYLSLDLPALITRPFFDTWGGPIRNSLPTALLVSTLFGEFNFGYLGWPLLSFLSTAFLPVAALPVIGFFSKPSAERLGPWLLATILIGGQLLFILAGNWMFTISGDSDARYWAPVFFPLGLLSSWGYEICLTKSSGVLRSICQLVPIVFFVLLGAFYLKLLVP